MEEYIVLLGGTGFNRDFQRVKKAIELTKSGTAWGTTLAACGMGIQNGKRENQFLAACALEEGVWPQRILMVESDEDNRNRNHRNEIWWTLHTIYWESNGAPARIIFVVEGFLHAWRVKGYAKHQLPGGWQAEIFCQSTGEKLTWARRFREARSFAKYLLWRLGR